MKPPTVARVLIGLIVVGAPATACSGGATPVETHAAYRRPPPALSLGVPAATPIAPAASASAIVRAPPAPVDARFAREVESGVYAVAIEKPPHVIALGRDMLWTHGSDGWRSDPLPRDVASTDDPSFSLFFGRDYRARIVGAIGGSGGRRVYLRYRDGRVTSDRSELGKFGASERPVVSVLGTADPEILCAPEDVCLLKSVRGWKTIAAPPGIERAALGEGIGWAIAGQKLWKLADASDAWVLAGPEGGWSNADVLVALRGGVCVLDSARDRLHFFDGTGWREVESRLEHPHGLWSPDGRQFVIVGDGGLATYDGAGREGWRLATGAPHPLLAIAGRPGGELYVGGPSGVFRVELPESGR